jgi:hypothetical protein
LKPVFEVAEKVSLSVAASNTFVVDLFSTLAAHCEPIKKVTSEMCYLISTSINLILILSPVFFEVSLASCLSFDQSLLSDRDYP